MIEYPFSSFFFLHSLLSVILIVDEIFFYFIIAGTLHLRTKDKGDVEISLRNMVSRMTEFDDMIGVGLDVSGDDTRFQLCFESGIKECIQFMITMMRSTLMLSFPSSMVKQLADKADYYLCARKDGEEQSERGSSTHRSLGLIRQSAKNDPLLSEGPEVFSPAVDMKPTILSVTENIEFILSSLNIPLIFPSIQMISSLKEELSMINQENHDLLHLLISERHHTNLGTIILSPSYHHLVSSQSCFPLFFLISLYFHMIN